jgi:hypothetical protein
LDLVGAKRKQRKSRMKKSKKLPTKNLQTKLKRTMLALLALTIVESAFILFGHRSPTLAIVLFLIIISLTLIIASTWIELKFETGGQKSVSYLKMLLFASPIIVFTIILQNRYQDYSISNNKRSAEGVVVKTYSEIGHNRFRETTHYYADINCYINGQATTKTISIISINEFKVGEKVTIEYSETEPELFNVLY